MHHGDLHVKGCAPGQEFLNGRAGLIGVLDDGKPLVAGHHQDVFIFFCGQKGLYGYAKRLCDLIEGSHGDIDLPVFKVA